MSRAGLDLYELKPAQVLLARYLLQAQLSSPGSIQGHQAEQLRLGLAARGDRGGRPDVQDELRARLATLLLLCRDLTNEEETACRLRYGCVAGSEVYQAARRPCDMHEGDGEEIVSMTCSDAAGEPMEGFVEVRGRRARLPGYEQIGAAMGVPAPRVRTLLEDARSKVSNAIKWRVYQATVEERYL